MADQLTSVATTPGIGDLTVTKAYDLVINRVYRAQPTFRQWVKPYHVKSQSHKGSSVELQKYKYMDNSVIDAATIPLSEENDVDSTKLPPTEKVILNFNEYGFAVTRTLKVTHMSFADIDMEIGVQIADVMYRALEKLVVAVANQGTNRIYAGSGNSATNQIEATDELSAANLRMAKTKLINRSVPTVDGQFHLAYAHPNVVHDLREETGSGGWRVPNEYGANQSKIWTGEIGELEGFRFITNPLAYTATDGTSSARVYRTYVQGPEAIVEGILVPFGTRLGPVVDKLGRFRTAGWYGMGGWALYRNESLEIIESGSSVTYTDPL